MFRIVIAAIIALASPLLAQAAEVQKSSPPAKGTKSCVISQWESPFLKERHERDRRSSGVPFYARTSSEIKFSVLKGGSLTVSVVADAYPGTKIYFLIGGKRYSGSQRFQLPLDKAALASLRRDEKINFTYTSWPYRTEMNREDIFSGFSRAYDECRSFMG